MHVGVCALLELSGEFRQTEAHVSKSEGDHDMVQGRKSESLTGLGHKLSEFGCRRTCRDEGKD